MASYLGFTLGAQPIGEITEALSAVIGGSARTFSTEPGEFAMESKLSAPGRATLFVKGFTPALFADIKIYNGGTGGVRFFGGTVIDLMFDAARINDEPWHKLECQDYAWQLNRYKRVRGTYSGLGINTCLRQVLASFTDPAAGFRVGYCPASLGDVRDLTVDDVSVTDVLDRLAEQADGFWTIDGHRRVHIFTSPDHLSTDSLTIDDTTNNFAGLRVQQDGSDIATRVIVHGDGSQTTALASSSATTVAIEECAPFVGATVVAGDAFANGSAFSYTGVSARSGPGNLTGVSGLTVDLPQGTDVVVRVIDEDATAQSDLSTAMNGLSGLAEILVTEPTGNIDTCTYIAAAVLAQRKAAYVSIGYRAQDQLHTGAASTVPGQMVTVSLTTPIAISSDYRVQGVEVSVKPGGKVVGTTLGFERKVALGPYNRTLRTGRILARR